MLRIWDMFLFEGVKVVFRTALAIMTLNQERILAECKDLGALMQYGLVCHLPPLPLPLPTTFSPVLHARGAKASYPGSRHSLHAADATLTRRAAGTFATCRRTCCWSPSSPNNF